MQNDWIVLLIGGNSSVGKTTISQEISRKFNIVVGQVDDYRVFLQKAVSASAKPSLHFFLSPSAFYHFEPNILCNKLIELGDYMSPMLEAVIERHISTRVPIIIEGDSIMPSLAAKYSSQQTEKPQVRSVFILELEEEKIFDAMQERGRNFNNWTKKEQEHKVKLSLHYGKWLFSELKKYRLPIINARPRETLRERLLKVASQNANQLGDL